MEKYRWADTDLLCEMADDARVRDLNRQLDRETIDALDPTGTHIMTLTMPHEHRAGEPYDLHFRTIWMLKVKDSMEPVRVSLDIMPDNFEKIREDWGE